MILSSLKNGPLREEIEAQGGIKLIYIDPPFDVGADFSMDIEIGGETLTKKPNVLEEIAYRDTWRKGADSFISMIYERLVLMRDLLAEDGSIYVHCDFRLNSYMRIVLDEIFGSNQYINEITWKRTSAQSDPKHYGINVDSIFYYSKSKNWIWNSQFEDHSEEYKKRFRNTDPDGRKWTDADLTAKGLSGGGYTYKYKGCTSLWRCPIETMEKLDNEGKLHFTKAGGIRLKRYLDNTDGVPLQTLWEDIFPVNSQAKERIDYPTQKPEAFLELILHAYRAETVSQFNCFQGKKEGRLVAVGPVNLPVIRLFVEEIILECRQKHITKVDILGFEFEMGLFPNIQEEAKAKGIDLAMKYIPRDVFDKRAIEKNQVVFHDVSFIEVKPLFGKGKNKHHIAIELTDFSVFYSQDSVDADVNLVNKKSKVIVDKGQVVKISKDKDGIVKREVLTRKWRDWIDYWSVDFNFESKREILRVKNPESGETEEVWSGDYVFENEWQSFRTKKDRTLELKSAFMERRPGRPKIAVKVVDIFGNDTMKIIEVTV